MAIVVEDGIIESRPCRLSALSRDQAGLSLPRSSRLCLYRERLARKTTVKTTLIRAGPNPKDDPRAQH
ncbi:hypothetical protein CR513_47372, partial [Mucuna pruriens]